MLTWLKELFANFFRLLKPHTLTNTISNTAVSRPVAVVPNNQAADLDYDNDDDFTSPKARIYDEQSESNIQFYPKLVDNLEADHQQLLRLYTNIAATLNIREYQLIPGQLNNFKEKLKAHLDTENIKFYGYLEQSLKSKNEEFQAMRAFRKEMRTIERTVIKFLDKWISNGIQGDTAEEFKGEYEAIGSALVTRIESEEKELYILYGRI